MSSWSRRNYYRWELDLESLDRILRRYSCIEKVATYSAEDQPQAEEKPHTDTPSADYDPRTSLMHPSLRSRLEGSIHNPVRDATLSPSTDTHKEESGLDEGVSATEAEGALETFFPREALMPFGIGLTIGLSYFVLLTVWQFLLR
jgi:hypothetical protein